MEPRWLTNFKRYDGVKEIKGAKHAPAILHLLDLADGRADKKNLQGIIDDETPYCSSALCGAMEEIAIRSPRSAWARSWLNWGVKLSGPAVGAIVIFERGKNFGHVAIVTGRTVDGLLVCFGANQNDMFRHSAFDLSRVLGYRWPLDIKLPVDVGFYKLPVTDLRGVRVSSNEQ
jgi:uncharacterized protein (TIGR02594 family)